MAPYPLYPQEPIHWHPSKASIDQYKTGLEKFIQKNGLREELHTARNFLAESTNFLAELLRNQPHLRDDHQKIFAGTKYA